MIRDELARAVAPEALTESVRRSGVRPREIHAHGGGMQSVRRATHRGHEIVIRTTYSIEVDGEPVDGHIEVTDDGNLHCHAVPNYSFPSAVDLVKQLIDAFPEDFGRDQDHGHDGHDGGDHGGH